MEVLSSTSAAVSWELPPQDSINGIIRGFSVVVVTVDTNSRNELFLSSDTVYIFQDLHPFYTYYYTISATTVGPGPYSTPVIQQMPEESKFILDISVKVLLKINFILQVQRNPYKT